MKTEPSSCRHMAVPKRSRTRASRRLSCARAGRCGSSANHIFPRSPWRPLRAHWPRRPCLWAGEACVAKILLLPHEGVCNIGATEILLIALVAPLLSARDESRTLARNSGRE